MVDGEGCLCCVRIPAAGGRACIFTHPWYYAQYNTAVLLSMRSIASSGSSSHDAGPATFSQALPEMSGNSVSRIRAAPATQDTPEILAWLNLPYDDGTPLLCQRGLSLAVSSLLRAHLRPDLRHGLV